MNPAYGGPADTLFDPADDGLKNGNRKFGNVMIAMSKVLTDAEIKEAADYFAALKPRP
jgi:cytochrome c553